MASDQSSEQELQFKKRARRRLVGAIALVLLMVTILPMVLDDRSSNVPQQEIAIHIPSQDGDEFTSKVAPTSEPSEEIVSGPILTAPVEQEVDADPEADPELAKPEVAKPVTASPVAPKPEPVKPAAESAKEVVKKEAPKAEVKPAAAKVEVHKADTAKVDTAKAESRKPEATAKSAASGFLVQIGVFSDPINVKNLQDKLSGQGLKSHTEVIATAGGDKTRLRVGPFASREQADQALGKVKAAGLSGMVISNK